MSFADHAYDAEIVTLIDEEGRSLQCYIEQSLELDEYNYLLLLPVDSPVIIMAWDNDNPFRLVEEPEETEALFADAKAVLAEQDLILLHTAFTLTATGELPPLEEDRIISFKFDEEDRYLEPEELQELTHFYYQEQKYTIYTPLTPLLFFARYNADGELELVSPDDENFQPILEELLFDELEQ
jgi:hypothetical protein